MANKRNATIPVFKKDDLIASAAVFEVQPEIVAGALHGKEEATEEEARQLIQEFLEKPKEEKVKNEEEAE